MLRWILIAAGVFAVYGLSFLAIDRITDTSALATQYVQVVKSGKEWEPRIMKARPAGWVRLGEVPAYTVAAILLSEDASFWTHNGFDLLETWNAFKTNLAKGKFARGGSTISQQVVKNVYLSGEKSIERKLRELVLALRMERQVSKRKILEIYLNVAEFGEGVYGINAAARHYFQKSHAALTPKESAFLAVLLPSPKKYSSSFRKGALTPFMRASVRRVLRKLFLTHRISESDYLRELRTPLAFEAVPEVEPLPPPGLDEEIELPDDDEEAASLLKTSRASMAL
ncbi:MAG: transglycosylase domain-containing protein [Bdellovibrionales bacterium]|nr:transglycosylase domain-containing protein [Bdellovibrionales bacterium]